jgi:hypothetical protein
MASNEGGTGATGRRQGTSAVQGSAQTSSTSSAYAQVAPLLASVQDVIPGWLAPFVRPEQKLNLFQKNIPPGIITEAIKSLQQDGATGITHEQLAQRVYDLASAKVTALAKDGKLTKAQLLELDKKDPILAHMLKPGFERLSQTKVTGLSDAPTPAPGARRGGRGGGAGATGGPAPAAVSRQAEEVLGAGLPTAVANTLASMHPVISAGQMSNFLNAATRHYPIEQIADELISRQGDIGSNFSLVPTNGKRALSTPAVREVLDRLRRELPEDATPEQLANHQFRVESLSRMAVEPNVNRVSEPDRESFFREVTGSREHAQFLAEARRITGRGNVLSKEEFERMPEGPLKAAAVYIKMKDGDRKPITAELLAAVAAEEALHPSPVTGFSSAVRAVYGKVDEQTQILMNGVAQAPLFDDREQRIYDTLLRSSPQQAAELKLARQQRREADLLAIGQAALGHAPNDAAVQAQLANASPEVQQIVNALQSQQIDPAQQQLMNGLPTDQRQMLEQQQKQMRNAQMMMALTGVAGAGINAAMMLPMLKGAGAGKGFLAANLIGGAASSILPLAMGGMGFLPGFNYASASNTMLTTIIAGAPLQSFDEQMLMMRLPPEQQAMMQLQARKQREALITSILTNLMNMRHEQLKQISQNLRA